MPNQYDLIKGGELDVGKLYVDTKQIYLDARANAAEFNEPRLRTDAMYTIVEMLGRFLRQLQTLRVQITKGEVGLKGFDADLAGLQKRYTNLYRPFFADMPHPAEWTDEQWKMFEEDLEGPILLWDLKTCNERWGIPFGSPPCEGPDLQMALSLLHQLGVAEQVQAELVASLYGLADITMKEIGTYWSDKGQKAAEATAQAFKDIASKVKDYFPNPNTPKHIAWGLGVALALGGGGYVWLKTRK
jgi:hypothetical protein